MHLSKRIISVLCVITIVISAISPAFAYSATDGFNPVSFWEYVYRGFGGGNRDGGFGGGGFGGSDPDSWTTSDDMKNDYNDFVSTLPATGYDNSGSLIWRPKWSDAYLLVLRIMSSGSYSVSFISQGVKQNPTMSSFHRWVLSDYQLVDDYPYQETFNGYSTLLYNWKFPVTGYYTLLQGSAIDYLCIDKDGLSEADTISYSSSSFNAVAGSSSRYNFELTPSIFLGSSAISQMHRLRVSYFTPVYSIIPVDDISTTYNINTRVNNFQGDYYDNVTNNYYNNTTIINETTNNYYDMTTNNYYTMSNWSYDYQSRTYFVTLEDGTTITVQFGDDCLTITNNNVANSYQYVINNNNTPSPNPETPSTCKHNWTETIDVAPTCLEGGHANFTCSLCGETYEQILSAKGHNWSVKEHVNTVYGENGVIVTQGHTLYECSACGEQWYTETVTPPPDVSGGSNILAWLQEFKTWLGDKLDNLFQGDGDTNNFWSTNKKSFTDVLSSLLQTLLDFLTDILEKLLGLVKDLLSFLFDLISSVVITGISDFFTGLKDSRLFDFVVKDDEGSVTALPEGVATVFAFFSGVILALPVELRSILLFGTAIIVLIGVIKIIKS